MFTSNLDLRSSFSLLARGARYVGAAVAVALLAGCATASPTATAPAATAPAAAPSPAATAAPAASGQTGAAVTLVQYGAGTLAVPFKVVNTGFQQANPNIKVQAQFAGSVQMAKQITQLHEPADLLAVADYNVIPQQLYSHNGSQAYANWYVGFVSNAITFVYTAKSKGASQINANNWYTVLAGPGVQIGRSNPNTDPSGYQVLQMLQLAETYYNQSGLAAAILKNAPTTNMRDTETELIAALESGQIDYLALYRSDAMQHHFSYLQLPPQIDLSDPTYSADYAKESVQTSNGAVQGKPIVYAVTIPTNAPHPQQAETWVAYLLGPEGQAAMKQAGFVVLANPVASGLEQMPASLQPLVKPWPAQ